MHPKEQGQTVHKLQISTFLDSHNYLDAPGPFGTPRIIFGTQDLFGTPWTIWDPWTYLGPPELFWNP